MENNVFRKNENNKSNKKKIAILTIYDLGNYGNRLQNYATVHLLQNMGYSVDNLIVNYSSLKTILEKKIKKKVIFDWNLFQENPNYVSSLPPLEKKRYDSFKEFSYKYIPPQFVRYISRFPVSKAGRYIRYFVGSDQVWNPTIKQAMDWSFLPFVPKRKRISWCASFGIDEITTQRERIAKNLKRLKHISVRESAAAGIVNELTGKNAEVLIDPTLMLSAKDWLEIAEKPEKVDCEKKYILTYFLGGRSDRVNADIEKYRNQGYEIYNLMDETQPDVFVSDPANFIYLISNASLILTDSFHACVFSFIFEKPFLVYSRENGGDKMMSRIDTLLEKMELKRKYVDSGLTNDVFEHDYSKGKKVLCSEQEKVKLFLNKALGVKI